jgi:ABC-type bacteriocin/lantibiotic exporter with double-glycine peptidase domain
MQKVITMYIAAALCSLLLSGCGQVLMDTDTPEFQDRYQAYDYCGIKAVKQTEKNSCGAACLASVADYWGVDLTEQQIQKAYPKPLKDGYSILELKAIAVSNGLDAYMLAMSEDPLSQLRQQLAKGRPVICAVSFPQSRYFAYDVPVYGPVYRALLWSIGPRLNHYVVVFGFDSEELLIMDPARGFVTLSSERFESSWSKKEYAALLCGRQGNEHSNSGTATDLD